jgi:hypothetical protein
MEDFAYVFRQVVRFQKFEEGGSSMEDQDRETRIDEDVEAHSNKASHKLANDEGNDVEGHMHKNSHKASHKLANDEGDDDVEGHMHKNTANKGMNKL